MLPRSYPHVHLFSIDPESLTSLNKTSTTDTVYRSTVQPNSHIYKVKSTLAVLVLNPQVTRPSYNYCPCTGYLRSPCYSSMFKLNLRNLIEFINDPTTAIPTEKIHTLPFYPPTIYGCWLFMENYLKEKCMSLELLWSSLYNVIGTHGECREEKNTMYMRFCRNTNLSLVQSSGE